MREYHAHETQRMQELDGLVLADFGQRATAFAIDNAFVLIALLIVLVMGGLLRWAIEMGANFNQHRNYHIDLEQETNKIIFETLGSSALLRVIYLFLEWANTGKAYAGYPCCFFNP